MRNLYIFPLLVGLAFALPAVDLSRGRKQLSDTDKISFPEDISSPFINKEEIKADHYKNAVKALFEVVIRLKKVVAALEGGGTSGNFVVSPLSVAVALGQVLLGARGETRRRLADVLTPLTGARLDEQLHRELGALLRLLQRLPPPEARDFALDVAAAFFVQAGLPVRDSYRYSVNQLYGTDLLRLNFTDDPEGAQQQVNAWMSEHTRGHIEHILPHPLPPTTAAVLANSIYFSGRWEQPFDPDLSIEAPFHLTPKSTVPVTLMRNSIEAMYANSSTFSLVALPYRHQQAAMYLVLPHDKEKDIGEFMSQLSLQELHRVIESLKLHVVNIAMPRMTLSMTFSLREPLMRLHKHKFRNEQRLDQTTAEFVVPSKDEKGKGSCQGRCEPLIEGNLDNKKFSDTHVPKENNTRKERDVLLGSNANQTINGEYRLASLIATEGPKIQLNNYHNFSSDTVGDVSDFYKPYINSFPNFGTPKLTVDPPTKWTRAQNKTSTTKPSTTRAKPTSTQRTTEATTETPEDNDTQVPSKLMLDLSGASDDPRFRIDDIIHQSWLEVTELGTEAAAATVTTIDYSGDSVVFLVNRPFLFFIRHEVTLAPVFWGVIADPTSGRTRLGSP